MQDLVMQIKSGNVRLMEELWLQKRGLIAWYAKRYFVMLTASGQPRGGVELEDLIQSGYFALCETVKCYDPEKGTFNWILCLCLKRAFKNATGGVRKEPLDSCFSLNRPIDGGEDPEGEEEFLDFIQDEREDLLTAEERIYTEQLHEELEKAISRLPAAQAEAIRNEYWKGYSQEETAALLGKSASFVSQLKRDGLRRIRNSSSKKALEAFLDSETNFYSGMGLGSYEKTYERPVETKIIKRERLKERIEAGYTGVDDM